MDIKLCIDFNSDEAFYIQLISQTIPGVTTEQLHEGDSLPFMHQMADLIGINIHTINKACTILRQEGFIKLDRRGGTVVSIGVDRLRVIEEMKRGLSVCLTRGVCNSVSRNGVHQPVDDLYDAFGKCRAEG